MKKIILFGSGVFGQKAFDYFGADRTYAFCDNSCAENGTKNGIRYITYNEFLRIYQDFIIILSVNPKNAKEIALQLNGDAIDDFLVFDSAMMDEISHADADDYHAVLNNDVERIRRERDYYASLVDRTVNQLNYLKSISDIRSLGKGTGYISYIQRRTRDFTEEVFDMLGVLDIKPFVAAGTALGLYRHNGYIPWDDDVDFGLMRHDYMKLLEYGRENFVFRELYLNSEGELDEAELFRQYPNEYLMFVTPNCLQIKKGTSWMDSDTLDFFAYDFYRDDSDYKEYVKMIDECKKWRLLVPGCSKMHEFMNTYDSICDSSNTIGFGLDSMDAYACPRKGWIRAEVFLPLRETEFEGVRCYRPNDLEEYLSYIYREFKNYPGEIDAAHVNERREIIKKYYINGVLIIRKPSDVLRYSELYMKLRTKGIYLVYAFGVKYLNDRKDSDEVLRMLYDTKVDFTDTFKEDYDFIITDRSERYSFKESKPVYYVETDAKPDYLTVKKWITGLEMSEIKRKMIYGDD